MRSMYTAATGMDAQMLRIDTIANNLANANTTGFKKSQVDFADLMYVRMRLPGPRSRATRRRRPASRWARASSPSPR